MLFSKNEAKGNGSGTLPGYAGGKLEMEKWKRKQEMGQ